ncbi:MAG TPA: hypothetical protein PLD84_10715, partial [Chitinophagales bacterium]|nr:hypothetical protein [Chitinophagales bacterium]
MKKILLSATLAVLFGSQIAGAQSIEPAKNSKNIEFLLAAQTSASKQHASMLDKIQQETEDLMITIAPAPLVSLAHLIDKKVDANKEKKAKRKAKKEKTTC